MAASFRAATDIAGPREVDPPAEDLVGLARCLAADASALAQTEIRRQEIRAQRYVTRTSRAAGFALASGFVGAVGWVTLSAAAVLAVEALGLGRAASLAVIGTLDVVAAIALGRAARGVYAAPRTDRGDDA